MPREKLLFVDTNVFLDFYRSRSDAALPLLKHVEAVAERLVMTYQIESEFKKNRQAAIQEGLAELKAPQGAPRLGIFSDAKASKAMSKDLERAGKRTTALKSRLTLALTEPSKSDPVYQICQRLFRQENALALTREDKRRHLIRRKAFKRFIHGCPPRKKNDTSIGDAFNWEWMLHCAVDKNADLYIVSRDSDYGITVQNSAYVNDHLRQEFADRVNQKGKIKLFTRLSEALKHFQIVVTKEEQEVEQELVKWKVSIRPSPDMSNLIAALVQSSAEKPFGANWDAAIKALSTPQGLREMAGDDSEVLPSELDDEEERG